MKAALVQNVAPSTDDVMQDWKSPLFSSDCKALILFGGRENANNTSNSHGTLVVGATDGTNAVALGMTNADSVDPSQADSVLVSNRCYAMLGLTVTSLVAEADLQGVTHPSDGLQIHWADGPLGDYLINGLLLGGDDIEVSVVSAAFSGGGSGQQIAVNHGLSGAPDLIICLGNGSAVNSSGILNRPNGGYFEIGFYDVATGAYASANSFIANAAATAADANYISTSFIAAQNNAGTLAYQVTINDVGASTFDMQTSANTSDGFVFVCIRGRHQRLVTQVGVAQTPPTGGTWTPISGMAATPQVVLWVPTRMTAVNASSTTDDAGHIGFGVSVRNPAGTQQAAQVSSDDDGAGVVMSRNHITNTKSLVVITTDGTLDFEAQVSSWNPDGLTLNVTNAAAGLRIPYMAFGVPAANAVISRRENTLVRM